MNKDKIKIGKRFGMLVVIEDNKLPYSMEMVRCDCGNTKIVSRYGLLNKTSRSCGCSRSKMRAETIKFNGERYPLVDSESPSELALKREKTEVLIQLIEHGLYTNRLGSHWIARMNLLTRQYVNLK